MPTNNWNSLLCTSYEFHYTITQTDPNNCLAHWLRVICGLQSSFGLTAPEMPLSKRRRTDRGVFFFLNSIEELLSDKRIGTVSWLELVFQKFWRRWRCDALFYTTGIRLCHFLRCTSFWALVLLDETDDVLSRPPAVVWVEVPRGRVEVDRGVPSTAKSVGISFAVPSWENQKD